MESLTYLFLVPW